MNKKLVGLMVLVDILFIGCAPTRLYNGKVLPKEETATIEDTGIPFWQELLIIPHILNTEHVHTWKINGKITPDGYNVLEVLPGEENLRVSYMAPGIFSVVSACIQFKAEPGHRYKVRGGSSQAKHWNAWVEDLTTSVKVVDGNFDEDCLVEQKSANLNAAKLTYTKFPSSKLIKTYMFKSDKNAVMKLVEIDSKRNLIWETVNHKDYSTYTDNRWVDEAGEHFSYWWTKGSGIDCLCTSDGRVVISIYDPDKFEIKNIDGVSHLIPKSKAKKTLVFFEVSNEGEASTSGK